jgi:hypothetical protein
MEAQFDRASSCVGSSQGSSSPRGPSAARAGAGAVAEACIALNCSKSASRASSLELIPRIRPIS